MGKQGINHLVLFHKDCCDVSMIKSENKKKKKKHIHAAIKLNLLKEEEKNNSDNNRLVWKL